MRRRLLGAAVGAAIVVVLALLGAAAANSEMVSVAIGPAGAPVADAWNPLRVTTRDAGRGTLTLTLELGSLLEGVQWSVVEWALEAGAGLRVAEFDVYLPAWRSLTWRYESGGRLLASGSLPRDASFARPVDLVVGAGAVGPSGPIAGRWIDVAARDLPERAAAYDGVRTLWWVASGEAPTPTAMLAAASAGVLVVIAPQVLAEGPWGELMPADGWLSLGPGAWTTRPPPSDEALEVWRAAPREVLLALSAAHSAPSPQSLPRLSVFLGVALYLTLLLITWRTGGTPGWITFAALLLVATLTLPPLLAPSDATLERRGTMVLSAGGWAQRVDLLAVRSLPEATIRSAGLWRRVDGAAQRVLLGSPSAVESRLPRWGSALYASPPMGSDAPPPGSRVVALSETAPW